MTIRHSAVSGTFYPNDCEEIEHYIAHFTQTMPNISCHSTPRAIIVPHAGYIYSGFTANLAYNLVASKRPDITRIVVLGPSHRVHLEGVSIALYDMFETPCGNITIDANMNQELKNRFEFIHFVPQAHQEHSTEVQMPFIQHYFPSASVVELVYGKITSDELSCVIDFLLKDKETLVVVSTDLSHFYTQKEAMSHDNVCIKAIDARNLDVLEGCEACGIIGVKALVSSALTNDLQPHFLDHRTSFERSKDASNVVGYTSFVFTH